MLKGQLSTFVIDHPTLGHAPRLSMRCRSGCGGHATLEDAAAATGCVCVFASVPRQIKVRARSRYSRIAFHTARGIGRNFAHRARERARRMDCGWCAGSRDSVCVCVLRRRCRAVNPRFHDVCQHVVLRCARSPHRGVVWVRHRRNARIQEATRPRFPIPCVYIARIKGFLGPYVPNRIYIDFIYSTLARICSSRIRLMPQTILFSSPT